MMFVSSPLANYKKKRKHNHIVKIEFFFLLRKKKYFLGLLVQKLQNTTHTIFTAPGSFSNEKYDVE